MANKFRSNIKNVTYFSILLFVFSCLTACDSKTNAEKKAFVIQNLITAQEQIGLSQLFNISGYYLTNNGMYVNYFEDRVYSLIYKERDKKPSNPRYFFCDVNEYIKISDLFKDNINRNALTEDLGLKIIDQNRRKCFQNAK